MTNDDVKIFYETHGKPENQPIIFVNGYSASTVTWCRQLDFFVQHDFYVITFDHRSHGKSQNVDFGLTLHRLAADLAELIAHLQLKNVLLVGHSMGAATIMAYEELFTDENLMAIITEDQAPTFIKSDDWSDGKFGRNLSDLTAFIDEFPRTKLTQKQLSDDVKRELGKGMLPFDFKRYRTLLQNVILQDWRANLTKENKPHLFLAGGNSPIFSPLHAESARNLQSNPQSESLIFEGCGHILHLEDEEKFNQTVLAFYQKLK